MDEIRVQEKYLAGLRTRYKIGQNRTFTSESYLDLILRKAELGIKISDIDFQWLAENSLFNAIQELKEAEKFREEDRQNIEKELLDIRRKYLIPENLELDLSSPVYSILWKLDAGSKITDSEIKLLEKAGCDQTIILISKILEFYQLQIKYKATLYQDTIPDRHLYPILQKLELREELDESEAEFLLASNLDTTLEMYWQQEEAKKAEKEFAELKMKYQVASHPDTSISSPLYSILKKIKEKQDLDNRECQWLEQQKLARLTEIDRRRKDKNLFQKLKSKYKVTQYQNLDTSSELFSILRKLEQNQIGYAEINWLIAENLPETVEIATDIHFKLLKNKYRIVDAKLARKTLYEIMIKLERGERLEPKQAVELIVQGILAADGEIAIAHYTLEAIFYQKEYQRTGNKWNLPSASSNWRKAYEPQKALQVTENLNLTKVREAKLKSALLVTRGGAFRDLDKLDDAKNCAQEAMEYQPDAHQPYTLMGATCYDKYEYLDGDKWFEMAIERGATSEDIDGEIKRIVRLTKDKDKRQEIVNYLIAKDPKRYDWARGHLK